jgi:hypothetical protein
LLHYLSYWPGFLDIIFLIGGFSLSISRIDEFFVSYFSQATTWRLYVVCIYGVIRVCLHILFLKHSILLFCHVIFTFFA